MNQDDYAILVGIDNYPEYGKDGTLASLKGPLNDVAAVKTWLLDPDGGDVPSANIFEVDPVHRRSDVPGEPNWTHVYRLFDTLYRTARNSRKSGTFGRRVYLYMTGHGFSPGATRACLYTAEARLDSGENVDATGWLNRLQDAGFFREFVLWVDACMDRDGVAPPGEPTVKPLTVRAPPLANFIAFAAQRPLRAIEHPIDEQGGEVHSAFTWALLQGLRGAAADSYGRVTGRTLADWLRNAMSARYDKRDWEDADVSKEPEIVAEDAGLIFARGTLPPVYDVILNFPAAADGGNATIWTGVPPARLREFPVHGTDIAVPLPPGLYVVETDQGALRHGFEVLKPGRIDVRETGVPVERAPGARLSFSVDPGEATAEIFLIDGRFSLVDHGSGRMATTVPPGVFKLKVRNSRAITQHIMLLDRDREAADQPTQLAMPSTVIPLARTAATHDAHQDMRTRAIADTAALPVPSGKAALMVMVRTFSSASDPVADTMPPWQGVQVVDASNQVVLDMEREADERRLPGPDGAAYACVVVAPGCYYLRQRLDASTRVDADGALAGGGRPRYPIEQSVIACAGWRTEAYILRRVVPGAADLDSRPRVAIAMRAHDAPMTPDTMVEDRLAETAKLAMANERRILNDALQDTLFRSGNPIAGIIGAHLLLIEQERATWCELARLPNVVSALRDALGTAHPDVEALAHRCHKARAGGALCGPPMFRRSWEILTQAAFKRPDLIPQTMSERVLANMTLPPFMVWTTDATLRAAAQRQLAHALTGAPAPAVAAHEPAPVPAHAASFAAPLRTETSKLVRARARALHIPPSALGVLSGGPPG